MWPVVTDTGGRVTGSSLRHTRATPGRQPRIGVACSFLWRDVLGRVFPNLRAFTSATEGPHRTCTAATLGRASSACVCGAVSALLLLAASPPLRARPYVVFSNHAAPVWGHDARAYGQAFTTDATGALSYVEFVATAKGAPVVVSVRLSTQPGGDRLAEVGGIRFRDDEPCRISLADLNVPVAAGETYLLELIGDQPWFPYMSGDNALGACAYVDGNPEADRDLWLTVAVEAQPAHLRIAGMDLGTARLEPQERGTTVAVQVVNDGGTPARLLDASLRFSYRGELPQRQSPPERYYQRFGLPERPPSDLSNQWWYSVAEPLPRWVLPGHTATLNFAAEALDGVTPGTYCVVPEVTWFDDGDNLVANGDFELGMETPPPGWGRWRIPEDAEAAYWVDEEDVRGRDSARSYVIDFRPQAGRYELALITTDPFPVLPGTTYRCGTWANTTAEPSVRQLLIPMEVNEDGQSVREEAHWVWYETPGWWHDWTRFTTSDTANRMQLSLRLEAFGEGKPEAVWWDGVYALPEDDIGIASGAEQTPLMEVPARQSRWEETGLAYLGADWETQGDWQPGYGNEGFVLCAMTSPTDIFGDTQTLGFGNWVSAAARPLAYKAWTSDPDDTARLFLPVKSTDDRRALWNPVGLTHTYSSWDDHGELHPFDGRGPDLYVSVQIPDGRHRLSLYFVDWDWHDTPHPRRHRVKFLSEHGAELLAFAVREFGSGVYHSLAVRGPQTVTFVVEKGPSVSSVLSGIFLSHLPLLPEMHAEGGQAGHGPWQASYEGLASRDRQQPVGDLEVCKVLKEAVAGETPRAVRPDGPLWQMACRVPSTGADREELIRRAVDAEQAEGGNERALAWLRGLFEAAVDRNDIAGAACAAEVCLPLATELAAETDAWEGPFQAATALLPAGRHPGLALDLIHTMALDFLSQVDQDRSIRALRERAERWEKQARREEAKGQIHDRGRFAAARLLLEAIKEVHGTEALGVEGAWKIAELAHKQQKYWWHRELGIEKYREVLQEFPDSASAPRAYAEIIRILLGQARVDEASQVLAEAVAAFPDDRQIAEVDWAVTRRYLGVGSPREGDLRERIARVEAFVARRRGTEHAEEALTTLQRMRDELAKLRHEAQEPP